MIRRSLPWMLGLTLWAAWGCGPTETPRCQPANCSGCCTEDGQCLGFSKQAFVTCGSGGRECKPCLPGYLCSQGRCAEDPDAGFIDLDSGTPPVDAGTDAGLICGGNGEACCGGSTCFLGLSCSRGLCQPTPPDAGPCGALGQPCCNGVTCTVPLTCQAATCRLPQTDGGTGQDAGTPKAIGEACSFSFECRDGLCEVVGFSGGYCTKPCVSQADCPGATTCSRHPNGGANLCLSNCATAPVVPGGCRTGYACDSFTSLTRATPVCSPLCVSPTTCGTATTCDARGLCCGSSGAACCDGTTCGAGLACQSGYCRPSVCGASGQACCATAPLCNANLACQTNTCVACGGQGQPCCVGNTCTTGTCQSGTCSVATLRPTGDPCTDFSQCTGSVCIQQAGNLWSQGSCSQLCSSQACTSGSGCTPYVAAPESHCLKHCAFDGGVGGCRTGYVCERQLIPTNPNQGLCFTACTSTTDCPNIGGSTLTCSQGFCCGEQGYRCCAGNTCPRGGTCNTALGGYCL